jgi:leucyl aminopeptidase
MIPEITFSTELSNNKNIVYLIKKKSNSSQFELSKAEQKFLKENIDSGKKAIDINSYSHWNFFRVIENEKMVWQTKEELRKTACKLQNSLKELEETEIQLYDNIGNEDFVLAFAEGLILSNYKFDKYFTDEKKKKTGLKKVIIVSDKTNKKKWEQLKQLMSGVFISRNLINEPLSALNAQQLSSEFEKMGKEVGFTVKVFDKKKITELKMGGLLAVNQGSVNPPTFTVMEWKPKRYINDNPLVLVGKGVVYDSGGLSLKPTSDSMDYMKCDMSGAAAVACTIYAVAKSKLPMHVVGLVPATENMPSASAYAPGDVIKMMNGSTVEMLNADAEGRLILADALSYAKKYDPMLVIDLATLTGSAGAAVGRVASVSFSKNAEEFYTTLEQSGFDTCERLVQFPLWEDYAEMIESKIADVKNVGGKYAGAITAAKFLERFTDYPWIHLDIAGPAFVHTKDSYRGVGGTGVGVRMLFDFINHFVRK